jgi:hypothetical protein
MPRRTTPNRTLEAGDETRSTMQVTGLNREACGHVTAALQACEVPSALQRRMSNSTPNDWTLAVPRLFTYWRGAAAEAAWQQRLRAALAALEIGDAALTISVAPWTPAPHLAASDAAPDDASI